MSMWLYDERGYPSGNAGGLVLRDHPEWEARGLLIANQEFAAGPVELAVPPGRLFFAAAFPVRSGALDLRAKVDLSGSVRDGRLRWQAPEGRWHVMAVTKTCCTRARTLMATCFKRCLTSTPDAGAHRSFHRDDSPALRKLPGQRPRQVLMGTFTDEPSS